MTVYIHALREEGDTFHLDHLQRFPQFLSTPSARRATAVRPSMRQCQFWYFYPRPPRGGRQDIYTIANALVKISIHALREEGDCRACRQRNRREEFLSTPSARRATRLPCCVSLGSDISIHALREEGDNVLESTIAGVGKFLSTPSARRATISVLLVALSLSNFYPRPPRGGRRYRSAAYNATIKFLSTPSARRATKRCRPCHTQCRISIHALREEGDGKAGACRNCPVHFYPRPPRGGRLPGWTQNHCEYHHFYPRPPRGGRPRLRCRRKQAYSYFYPRPPRGGRLR